MKRLGAWQRIVRRYRFAAVGAALVAAGLGQAVGQASATASAAVSFSVFAGATGTYTGLNLAKNLGFTAGADVTLRSRFGLYPSIEVRGTYPVDSGRSVGEKNILAGINLSRHLGRLEPYGDILAGRGELDFVNPFPNPTDTILYSQTASVVIAPGGGVNFRATDHFYGKADFQFERYETPVTTSGTIYSKAFTLGIAYHLPLGGLGHGLRFR